MTEKARRTRVNRELAAMPNYHAAIPNGTIDEILTRNGFEPLAEGIYCGREGRLHEQVGPNTWLVMTWHKMEETGRYEVVTYVA